MFRYISPLPMHALVLWVVWLLLNEFTPGHIILGAILAIAITWFVSPLSDPHPAIKKPLLACIYIAKVLKDIVVSNFVETRLYSTATGYERAFPARRSCQHHLFDTRNCEHRFF